MRNPHPGTQGTTLQAQCTQVTAGPQSCGQGARATGRPSRCRATLQGHRQSSGRLCNVGPGSTAHMPLLPRSHSDPLGGIHASIMRKEPKKHRDVGKLLEVTQQSVLRTGSRTLVCPSEHGLGSRFRADREGTQGHPTVPAALQRAASVSLASPDQKGQSSPGSGSHRGSRPTGRLLAPPGQG